MRRLFRKLLRRARLGRDLEAELAFHREMSAQNHDLVGLGNTSLIKEQVRDVWRFNLAENLWRDLVYGLRGLRASPAVLFSALLSLGLAIGANTAIFQLLDAVRLKTLPVQKPQELAEVQIAGGHGGMGVNPGEYPQLTRPIWQELRVRQQAFSEMFAWSSDRMNVGEGERLRNVRAIWVSGNFFRVLGIRPWRGRLISPEDEGPCPTSVGVVSYAFWQNAMGGGALGRTWVARDADIVGVTPPNFFGLSIGDSFDIALPLCRPKELERNLFDIAVMGRLRPGWTIRRASDELRSISSEIFAATAPADYSPREIDTYKRFKLTAVPATHGVSVLREQYNSSLWLLLAITGLVLLIACVNLANLLLARASARGREMGVRLALGASAPRLLQQLFVEAALLAAIGAAFGIGLVQPFTRAIVWALSTEGNEVSLPIAPDGRVILFTVAVSAIACLIFGLAPLQYVINAPPIDTLRAGMRGASASRRRFLTQRTFVVAQIAISLVLLVSASLFITSFRKLLTFDPGMRERDITVAFLAFDDSYVAPNRDLIELQRQLLEDVKSIPGVMNAGSATTIPLIGGSWEHGVHVGSIEGTSKFTWVSPGYLNTMGIPVIAGRNFKSTDTRSSQRVAIVNNTFVRHFMPNSNPIGQSIRTIVEPGYPSTPYQIVGVIRDTKYNSLWDATPPMAFAPASQYPHPSTFNIVMIHTKLAARTLVSTFQRELSKRHPGIVVTGGDFQKSIRDGMVQERVMAILSGFFGLIAALMAAGGLYGVMSYLISSRRSELGIRVALGASRPQIRWLVMREVCALLLIGSLLGVVLSLLAGRAASSLLFGLTPYDPFALTAASVLLIAVSMLASSLPARRASKLDPMIVLRCE